jgi:hypothetical protein
MNDPLLPRPKGGKDAEGMKKQIPSNIPPTAHHPPVWRNWKKKMSWPSRVTGA